MLHFRCAKKVHHRGNRLNRAAIHHKINETLSEVKEWSVFITSILSLCYQRERGFWI